MLSRIARINEDDPVDVFGILLGVGHGVKSAVGVPDQHKVGTNMRSVDEPMKIVDRVAYIGHTCRRVAEAVTGPVIGTHARHHRDPALYVPPVYSAPA